MQGFVKLQFSQTVSYVLYVRNDQLISPRPIYTTLTNQINIIYSHGNAFFNLFSELIKYSIRISIVQLLTQGR